jgi:hypothetical protein
MCTPPVAALDEVNLVTRDEVGVTAVERLRPINADDSFRVMCEVDAERSELFLSRAAILVEGMTEKITFPFVFQALGLDADREQISIVECGGKANLRLFIEICRRRSSGGGQAPAGRSFSNRTSTPTDRARGRRGLGPRRFEPETGGASCAGIPASKDSAVLVDCAHVSNRNVPIRFIRFTPILTPWMTWNSSHGYGRLDADGSVTIPEPAGAPSFSIAASSTSARPSRRDKTGAESPVRRSRAA